jgi:DNA gyrase subunit A
VRRTETMAFAKIRQTGIRAIRLADGDDLISVRELPQEHWVLLATKNGLSIRFPGDSLRILGRTTMGVKGINLRAGDELVGVAIIPNDETTILTVTSNGFGKRTPANEYRVQGRAGTGIITIKVNERNGSVVGAMMVEDEHQLMIVTDFGKIIRIRVSEISVIGRNTQGVKLINLEDGERVVAVERMVESEEEEEDVAEELPTSTRFHSNQLLRKDIMADSDDGDDDDEAPSEEEATED